MDGDPCQISSEIHPSSTALNPFPTWKLTWRDTCLLICPVRVSTQNSCQRPFSPQRKSHITDAHISTKKKNRSLLESSSYGRDGNPVSIVTSSRHEEVEERGTKKKKKKWVSGKSGPRPLARVRPSCNWWDKCESLWGVNNSSRLMDATEGPLGE